MEALLLHGGGGISTKVLSFHTIAAHSYIQNLPGCNSLKRLQLQPTPRWKFWCPISPTLTLIFWRGEWGNSSNSVHCSPFQFAFIARVYFLKNTPLTIHCSPLLYRNFGHAVIPQNFSNSSLLQPTFTTQSWQGFISSKVLPLQLHSNIILQPRDQITASIFLQFTPPPLQTNYPHSYNQKGGFSNRLSWSSSMNNKFYDYNFFIKWKVIE